MQTYAVNAGPVALAAADLNGDGDLDAVSANSNDGNGSVLLSDRSNTFQSQLTVATTCNPSGVFVGDVDQDGRPDLVFSCYNGDISIVLNTSQ